MLAICVLFFLSGISGLVYQVVWVREFGLVFGTTVYSAATVTAVFMGGLGVGSLVVGRFSDRRHASDRVGPLRSYGLFEVAIALLGLAVALLLPELEAFSSRISEYRLGPEGWWELSAASNWIRYAVALLLLLPITFLMGGTLTLLIRFLVVDRMQDAGWRIGALYGVNTAGAALGAFMTDFALIPNLGILNSQGVAIAFNLVAGGLALVMARRAAAGRRGNVQSAPAPAKAGSAASDPRARLLLICTALTLLISGFVAMGFEIAWFRYLRSILGGYRGVFSLLMTVILSGIFLGSFVGGYLARKTGRPVALFLAAQAAFIVTALVPLALLGPTAFDLVDVKSLLGATHGTARGLAEAAVNLWRIALVVFIPALLMGCTFPLTNAHVQRVEASLGTRAGLLYLANTLGNVAGSLATGFLLLPALGQQDSIALLTALAALGLVPLWWSTRSPGSAHERVSILRFATCFAVIGAALVGWFALPANYLLKHVAYDPASAQRVVAVSEGINETVVVLEGLRGRSLFTNGHSMSATSEDAQRYMRLFSHLPLLSAENPERVLVICFGVGTTLHAASLHPSVQHLEVADLSKNVLSQAHHFAHSNHRVLEDERVSVFVNDGRQHLRMQEPETYDLITLEPPPIAHAGVVSLYTRDFYALAKSRLRGDGFMTQWLPAYQVNAETNLSLIRSFVEVFPNSALLSGYERELILIGRRSGPLLDANRVRDRLDRMPEVRRDLEGVGAGSLTALVAGFVAGPEVLARATSSQPLVSDDRPLLEYVQRTDFTTTRLPDGVFDAAEVSHFCPDCFQSGLPTEELDELPTLIAELQRFHRGDAFLEFTNFGKGAGVRPVMRSESACQLQSVQSSAYFRGVFGCAP
jgi:spermidine synthase